VASYSRRCTAWRRVTWRTIANWSPPPSSFVWVGYLRTSTHEHPIRRPCVSSCRTICLEQPPRRTTREKYFREVKLLHIQLTVHIAASVRTIRIRRLPRKDTKCTFVPPAKTSNRVRKVAQGCRVWDVSYSGKPLGRQAGVRETFFKGGEGSGSKIKFYHVNMIRWFSPHPLKRVDC